MGEEAPGEGGRRDGQGHTMAVMKHPLYIYIVSARVHTLYLGPVICFSFIVSSEFLSLLLFLRMSYLTHDRCVHLSTSFVILGKAVCLPADAGWFRDQHNLRGGFGDWYLLVRVGGVSR